MTALTCDDVYYAGTRLHGRVRVTPLLEPPLTATEMAAAQVLVKAEAQQEAHSYAFRGAYTALDRLGYRRRHSVVCASRGPWALATAWAAHLWQESGKVPVPVIVVVPPTLAQPHRTHLAKLGARVVYGPASLASEIARQSGAALVPPDGAAAVAGAGTIAEEMLTSAPELHTIVVPIGRGALAAGTILAASRYPHVRVIAVQPERACAAYRSWRVGRPIDGGAPEAATAATSLDQGAPAATPWAILQGGLHEVVLVSEEQIAMAIEYLAEHYGLAVPPSAAVAMAGARAHAHRMRGPIGVIVSAGIAAPCDHAPTLIQSTAA